MKRDEKTNIEVKIKELEPTYETACLALKEAEREVSEIEHKIDELNNQKDSKTELYELGMVSLKSVHCIGLNCYYYFILLLFERSDNENISFVYQKSKSLSNNLSKQTVQRDKLEKMAKEATAVLQKKLKEAKMSGEQVDTKRSVERPGCWSKSNTPRINIH